MRSAVRAAISDPLTVTTFNNTPTAQTPCPTLSSTHSPIPYPSPRPAAFIANTAPLFPKCNSPKIQPRRKHRSPHHRPATTITRVTICCQEDDQQRTYPEDFDRDYYPKLKAEYADDDQVVIFAKDDYELDPLDVPWLEDYRGRDLDKIRTEMKSRPPVAGELEGLPEPAMRISDLHTKEEMDDFEPGFRHHDSVSGNIWTDPMPESDFDGDVNWIDFRKFEKKENDDDLSSLDPPPRKRKQYASYEEEFEALRDSADEMQAELLDLGAEYEPQTWGEQNPVPDPDDFRKWQRAAKERGGNASQNDSFLLSPAKLEDRDRESHKGDRDEEEGPARQFPSLVRAHVGKWRGKAYLYSVSTGADVAFTQEEEFEVVSETTVEKSGDLEWTAEVHNSYQELISATPFKVPEHPDELVPGRAVSIDGSFACGSKGIKSSDQTDGTSAIELPALSFSQKCLRSIIGNRAIKGELEICMMSNESDQCRLRNRVILCSVEKERRRKKNGGQQSDRYFSHVLFVSEYCSTGKGTVNVPPSARRETHFQMLTSLDVFKGKWNGSSQLLHPEFPPLAYQEKKTTFDFRYTSPITLDLVTWVESEIPDTADGNSQARARTLAKKKTSKRVAAARQYDQRRLSECSFLSEEKVGDRAADTFAWREVRSNGNITGLFSPRTGKFVDDFCGLVLANNFLLTFPYQTAFPNLPNVISLTEFTSPRRKRVNVARNDSGTLVGVLFVNEVSEVDDTSDQVALYV